MELLIFYFTIFAIGTVFGSFFTLAVYRIPLKQDITHKRSYCPKCMHRLSFIDMIPVLSYIFLGGKCRYCKEKIRIRYLLLEILTGTIFLLFAMSLNICIDKFEIYKLTYILFGILYLSGIIIIAGIDKERHQIQKSVIIYEVVVAAIYMIYLYVVEKANIYRYVIYLLLVCIFLIIENIYLKKKLKSLYTLEVLTLSMIITIFSSEIVYILSVILTLLIIGTEIIAKIIVNKNKKIVKENVTYSSNLPIGYYLICSSIISLIITNWIACRW